MPKKIDSAVRDRAVRLVQDHRSEYPSLTAAAAAVARITYPAVTLLLTAAILVSVIAGPLTSDRGGTVWSLIR
ncbi:hypothetical protein [Subtercola boreus]|nr:hypothetical protein [Subtercola boreus]